MGKRPGFWEWFRSEVAEFPGSNSTSDIVDQVHKRLVEIDSGLAVEVSEKDSSGLRELIISANGDEALFEVVERLVSEAPAIDGWVPIALKPARGFDFVFKRDGLEVRPAEWSFRVLESEDGDLGLQILSSYHQAELDDWTLEVILETGLGEKQFSSVKYVEVTQIGDTESSSRWLPITDLSSFLNFRAGRIGSRENQENR